MIWVISPFWVTILDFVVWFVISMGVGYYYYSRPDNRFIEDDWLTSMRSWERNGEFYQKTLRIMIWKKYLPDGSRLTRKGFQKKHLQVTTTDYLQKFILESRRAEWTHFVSLLFTPLFIIWNTFPDMLAVIVYAVLFNIPCLLTQRFNRIRLSRVVAKRH